MRTKTYIAAALAFIASNIVFGYHAIVKRNYGDAFIYAQLLIFWCFVLERNIHNLVHEMMDDHMAGVADSAEGIINDVLQKFEIPGQAIVKTRKQK